MAFDYYNRLSRIQRRIYRRSDAIDQVTLGAVSAMQAAAGHVHAALADGDQSATRRHSNGLIGLICDDLGVTRAQVRVLARRPTAHWGELHGLYEPAETDSRARITVWMRTAQRRQVVAFRTYLRTLLHEVCHHLDYELFGLDESFHTEGFFQRESSLVNQLIGRQSANGTPRPR